MADFAITLGTVSQTWTIDDAEMPDVIAAIKSTPFPRQQLSDDDAIAQWQQNVFKQLTGAVKRYRTNIAQVQASAAVPELSTTAVSVITIPVASPPIKVAKGAI